VFIDHNGGERLKPIASIGKVKRFTWQFFKQNTHENQAQRKKCYVYNHDPNLAAS
jgi:hypothetical protein